MPRRPFALVVTTMLFAASVLPAMAQQGDPNVPQGERERPTGRYDLAAMSLGPADVPADYSFSFGVYYSAAEIAALSDGEGFTPEELEAVGLLWYYQSWFESVDGRSQIQNYFQEFESPAAARRGFDLLEDETRFDSGDETSIDQPGLDGIGEEPSEITATTVTNADGSIAGQTLDATFRMGRLLVGVAIHTVGDMEPDEQLLADLAARAVERVDAVREGISLPGVDTSIPPTLLSFPDAVSIQESYVSADNVFGPSMPGDVLDDFSSAYIRWVSMAERDAQGFPLPVIALTVARFDDEVSGLALMNLGEGVQPPYAGIASVPVDRIPGATAVAGYSFANIFDNASPDSFRLVMLVDTDIVVVEVQGAASPEEAQAVARALAAQQVACAGADEPCPAGEVPPELGG
jgi:hypothetical protein